MKLQKTDPLDKIFKKEISSTKPKVIYKTKEVFKIPFDEKELGYIEKALTNYLSGYRGNLKKCRTKGKDTRQAGNYLDILYVMLLYKKMTNLDYYDKELFDLLRIKKEANIQELINKRRKLIHE